MHTPRKPIAISRTALCTILSFAMAGCAIVAGVGDGYTLAGDGSAEAAARDGATDSLLSPDARGDASSDVSRDAGGDVLPPPDAPTVDASPDVTFDVTPEASSDGSRPEAGDGCSPQPEDCTNGVDDDCNGLIDCADPACHDAGFTCTSAAVPTGWTLVAFDPTGAPSCGSAYASPSAVYSADAGAAQCGSCLCSGSNATASGSLTLSSGLSFFLCGGTPASMTTLQVGDGGCQTFGTAQTFHSDAGYQISDAAGLVVDQGTCTGASAATHPAIALQQGETCASTALVGKGCDADASCAAPPGAGFSLCVASQTAMSCPADFPKATFVSKNPIVDDTRGCACTCATKATLDYGTVTVYAASTCTGPSFGITQSCSEPGSFSAGDWYTVDVSFFGSTCAQTGPVASTGGVAFANDPTLVCCP